MADAAQDDLGLVRRFTPVTRETLQGKVYDELKRGLMAGAFHPGEAVTLRRLAEMFGTSIMPVREAVNRLIAEGALRSEPNRSVIVPLMPRNRFGDLTDIRVSLETIVTRKACRLMTVEHLSELEDINEQLLQAIVRGDLQTVVSLNRDFHFHIYRAAQSDVLMQYVESLWMQVGPFLYVSAARPEAGWTADTHLRFINAIKDCDEESAVAAIHSDIRDTADALLKCELFAPD